MSQETIEYLHDNVLAGFTDRQGPAWWASRGLASTDSFGEPNHYPGAIPLDDVLRRLPAFANDAISAPLQVTYPNPFYGQEFDYTEAVDVESETVTIQDAERQVILRPDTGAIYGVFKSGYVIHQFREKLIEYTSQILDTSKSELGIANVVVLKNGAVAVVQFEVPDNVVHDATGVTYRPSLYAATSLNGMLSSTWGRCITNIVCDNTMGAGIDESKDNGTMTKAKHSKYSMLKLDAIRAKLEIEFTVDSFNDELTSLSETKVSGKAFSDFLKEINPIPEDDGRGRTMAENKQDALLSLWLGDDRVAPWTGTAFGVLQLMNTYSQQIAPVNTGTIRLERNFFDLASGKTEKQDADTLKVLNKVLANA